MKNFQLLVVLVVLSCMLLGCGSNKPTYTGISGETIIVDQEIQRKYGKYLGVGLNKDVLENLIQLVVKNNEKDSSHTLICLKTTEDTVIEPTDDAEALRFIPNMTEGSSSYDIVAGRDGNNLIRITITANFNEIS